MHISKFEEQLEIYKQLGSIPNILIETSTTSFVDIIKSYINNIYRTTDISNQVINNEYVFYINCLKHNNTTFLREKLMIWIKNSFSFNCKASNKNVSQFRTIIFAHADNLTLQFQSALRRIIETNSVYNRFIFLTTSREKVIEPIRSRTSYIYIFDDNKITLTNLNNENQIRIHTIFKDLYNKYKNITHGEDLYIFFYEELYNVFNEFLKLNISSISLHDYIHSSKLNELLLYINKKTDMSMIMKCRHMILENIYNKSDDFSIFQTIFEIIMIYCV